VCCCRRYDASALCPGAGCKHVGCCDVVLLWCSPHGCPCYSGIASGLELHTEVAEPKPCATQQHHRLGHFTFEQYSAVQPLQQPPTLYTMVATPRHSVLPGIDM